MILIPSLLIVTLSVQIFNSQAQKIPTKSVFIFTPSIQTYNATQQLFINKTESRFARIVQKDHFINHQLRKDHPQRLPKQQIWNYDGYHRGSNQFRWSLKEMKKTIDNNRYFVLLIFAFLGILYWRSKKNQEQPSLKLPTVDEQITLRSVNIED